MIVILHPISINYAIKLYVKLSTSLCELFSYIIVDKNKLSPHTQKHFKTRDNTAKFKSFCVGDLHEVLSKINSLKYTFRAVISILS